MPPKKKTKTMSDQHKSALAAGREHARHVRAYLEALENHRPKRGRKVSRETMEQRLASIEEEMATADPMKRLTLAQTRRDLQSKLATPEDSVDMAALAKAFSTHAKPYAESKGISYQAFRDVGVPADVLKAAGISR